MEHVLNFFSDILLITGGIVVTAIWLVIFGIIAIEIHDLIFGDPTTKSEED